MSHKMSVALGLAVAVIWLAGCTVIQQGAAKVSSLNEAESGTTVQLNKGDTLEVVLAANPTTGYTWEQASGDTAVVKLTGEPEFKADSSALGAGGKMTLRFQAVGAGQTLLQLVYHRTFEQGVAPLKTFQVTVVVK